MGGSVFAFFPILVFHEEDEDTKPVKLLLFSKTHVDRRRHFVAEREQGMFVKVSQVAQQFTIIRATLHYHERGSPVALMSGNEGTLAAPIHLSKNKM